MILKVKATGRGKFADSAKYKSVFRRLCAIDNFVDHVVSIDVAPGKANFDFENRLTSKLGEKYKHARSLDKDEHEMIIVMVNRALGIGTYFPETRVYVSLAQLKVFTNDIVFAPDRSLYNGCFD